MGGVGAVSSCGVFISSGSSAWPAPEGAKTYLMAWGESGRGVFSGGHPAGLEDKNGDNMAPQYLLVTKKNKTLLPAEVGQLSTWLPGAS